MSARHRVLVVDDSAFARKVIRELLERTGQFEVVGIARDGLEALEAIARLRPDVITLDLVMPGLDGIGVLDALQDDDPRAVVVSISGSETELGATALLKGAVDIVGKPSALATDRLYEMGEELASKVRAAAIAQRPPRRSSEPAQLQPLESSRFGLLAVGASTGGPHAIGSVIAAFPERLPVPIVVALHIPSGYTQAFADRLCTMSRMPVVEGRDGALLEPGTIVIMPGGSQSEVVGTRSRLRLAVSPGSAFDRPYMPSIDLLFESAARVAAPVLGVVLTGMGDDGTEGARRIRSTGGKVLTESPETCVIYGMPRAVYEAGLSDGVVPLERMAERILEQLER